MAVKNTFKLREVLEFCGMEKLLEKKKIDTLKAKVELSNKLSRNSLLHVLDKSSKITEGSSLIIRQ